MEEENVRGMIDISSKEIIKRTARVSGEIILNTTSIAAIKDGTNPKGDVLENAKLAAVHAVKKTPDLVFLAHPIRITSVKVDFELLDDRVKCMVEVNTIEKTGVEIEAMAGVMNALLAIFDLSKRYEKDDFGQYLTTKIVNIEVIEKIKELK